MNLVVNLELTPQISADGHQDAAPSLAPLPPPPTLFSTAGNKQIPNLRLGRAPPSLARTTQLVKSLWGLVLLAISQICNTRPDVCKLNSLHILCMPRPRSPLCAWHFGRTCAWWTNQVLTCIARVVYKSTGLAGRGYPLPPGYPSGASPMQTLLMGPPGVAPANVQQPHPQVVQQLIQHYLLVRLRSSSDVVPSFGASA